MTSQQLEKKNIYLKKQIEIFVGKEYLKSLFKINFHKTLFDFIIIYSLLAIIILSIYILDTLSLLYFSIFSPFVMILTAITFNWINVQVHEASHKLLFQKHFYNDLYCDALIGSWALHDVKTYRTTHFDHHNKLHTDEDPDKIHYTSFTGSYRELIKGILHDLFSITALKRILQVLFSNNSNIQTKKRQKNYSLIFKIISQIIIIMILYSFSGPMSFIYYFVFFLIPLFCIFPVLLRIRVIVQHYSSDLKKENLQNWISRTTISNFFEHFIIGARMDYHFEHHLYPNIPYYNLKKLHFKLLNLGFFENRNDYHTNDFAKSFVKLSTAK